MIKILHTLEETCLAVLFAALTLVPFSQVIARKIFNSGAIWAVELTQFLFAWLIMLGMAYGVKVGGHIGVDAFVTLFPKKTQRFFGLLAITACLIYCLILGIGAWDYISKIFHIGIESEDLHIPLWIPLSVLPFGLCLLFFRFSQIAWRILTGKQLAITFTSEADTALAEEALTQTALDPNPAQDKQK